MCTIDGYVQNTKSIPSDNYLGIAYHHPDGTDTHAFPINIETHAYIDPDQDDNMEWAADPSDNIVLHNSPSSDKDPGKHIITHKRKRKLYWAADPSDNIVLHNSPSYKDPGCCPFYVSLLAYPNLLGTKGYIVVVDSM